MAGAVLRKLGLAVALGALLWLLLFRAVSVQAADEATSLINELMCPTDCVETLAVCQMPQAATMRGFIREKVLAGWARQEIVDNLVSQYGERILAAPTKQGFNLTAWLTPGAVVLLGGGFVGYLVVSWVRRRTHHTGSEEMGNRMPGDADLQSYRSLLDRELEQFEL